MLIDPLKLCIEILKTFSLVNYTSVRDLCSLEELCGSESLIIIPLSILSMIHNSFFNLGEIWTKRRLDKEKQATYELPVLAADGSGKSDWTTVHLTVEDNNDNTPIFQLSEYKISVYSNITVNSIFLKVSHCYTKIKLLFYEIHVNTVKPKMY